MGLILMRTFKVKRLEKEGIIKDGTTYLQNRFAMILFFYAQVLE